MAQKKSFKDNPALQFISIQEEDTSVIETETQQAEQQNNVPMKLNPLYVETKSKRLNLLIKPSLHTKLYNMAKFKEISLNELINKALEDFAEKESCK